MQLIFRKERIMKKYLYLNLILAFTIINFNPAIAQSSKKEHKTAMSSGTVSIVDIDEIVIEGHSGSDVIVSSMVEESEENDRSRGLKVLNSMGLDDNTGFGISVYREGDVLFVRKVSNSCSCGEVTIQVPKSVKVSVEHGNYNAEALIVKNVSSELEITTNYHEVRLENVTGPMAVKTVYGSIDAIFSQLSQEGSVSLYSVYELVDVTIPKSSKMNVSLSAPNGNVYSNVDVAVTSDKKESHGSSITGSTIKGTTNGGGVEFNVKSAYEDVYLRYGN